MKKHLLLLCILTLHISLLSQDVPLELESMTPARLGFEKHTFSTPDLGEVNYYASVDTGKVTKPLLIYLDGSGALPLFQRTSQGLGSTVLIDFQKIAQTYRLLLIGKPGVPFVDDVRRDENGFPLYDAPDSYKERLTFQWRVNAAIEGLDNFLSKQQVDTTCIAVLGFSEGAQIAAALANREKKVTQLLLFSSNGLNQFFNPLINARMKAKSGQLTEVEAQAEVDSLFRTYRMIHADPKSADKEWWGHTYKRWSTFSKTAPVNNLYELDIPIYMANGSLDHNSVLSADYVNMIFMIQQKDNLTYKVYPSYDHQFNELQYDNGEFKQAIPRLQGVFQDAFLWLERHKL